MTQCCAWATGQRYRPCDRLSVQRCPGAACPWRQTAEQRLASGRKAGGRLRSLSADKQLYIADKYYGGAMPWRCV